jgi:uracil-DNA glycosylase family protein
MLQRRALNACDIRNGAYCTHMVRRADDSASQYLPERRSVSALRTAATECHGCALWEHATQTVFGQGPAHAKLLFVGEQPGNEEDLRGQPFVGPAGRLFDECLEEAGIDRETSYVTNAVKHFKWEPRGKRRLHKRPAAREIWACRPWLQAELAAVKPEAVVCLGAVAAQSLLGSAFRVTVDRGRLIESPIARIVMATVHPSSLLRAPTPEDRARERKHFIADLKIAARALAQHSTDSRDEK